MVVAFLAQLADTATFLVHYGPTRPELNPLMATLAWFGVWLAVPFKFGLFMVMLGLVRRIRSRPRWPGYAVITVLGVLGTAGNMDWL